MPGCIRIRKLGLSYIKATLPKYYTKLHWIMLKIFLMLIGWNYAVNVREGSHCERDTAELYSVASSWEENQSFFLV